ncbi:MAG: tetratricopeptide repeat protein [Clostridiales bacterium]|nr:tetratricopeptide repeat protein [Clostridiales bacterium]
MNKFNNALNKFILPVAAIVLLSSYNFIAGLVGVALYIVFLLFINRASFYTYIGRIKYADNKLSEALAWYERAYATGKTKPKTSGSYAYLLLKNGMLDKAEKILNGLMNLKLQKDEVLYIKSNLALVLWKKGDLDAAIAMLEDILPDFRNSTIYGSLGTLVILKGEMEKAIAINAEAYEFNSSNTIIMDNLANAYYLNGQYRESEDIYDKLMEKNPTFPEAYYNYGLLLLSTGRAKKAVEMFTKADGFVISYLGTVSKEEIAEKLKEAKRKVENESDDLDYYGEDEDDSDLDELLDDEDGFEDEDDFEDDSDDDSDDEVDSEAEAGYENEAKADEDNSIETANNNPKEADKSE